MSKQNVHIYICFINVFSYQIRDCSIDITILNIGFPRELLKKILFAYSLTFEHRTLRPCNQTKLHTKRTIFSGVGSSIFFLVVVSHSVAFIFILYSRLAFGLRLRQISLSLVRLDNRLHIVDLKAARFL